MLEKYLKVKKAIDELKKEKLEIEKEIYTKYKKELSLIEEGTRSFVEDGFKVSIIKKISYSVDELSASALGYGFKKKYTFDKRAYNKLSDEQKKDVDGCLTTKPLKPTFKVEVLQ